ncbi:STAS domain-containing protein [Actinomadura viridis]|uniref:STAS domain-containing protein n=1 Tax=Actinomadura viridis TaxID=58110 RepID=UPI0036BC114E
MNTYTAEGHTDLHPRVNVSVVRGPITIATLEGELDIATAPALLDGLLALLRPGLRLLVLDLSHLWFCDAAGASVLIGVRRRAMLLGIPLRLAAPRSRVARVLSVTGLDRALVIHSTLRDALATPPSPARRHVGRSRVAHRAGGLSRSH